MSGSPIPDDIKDKMEKSFDADFSSVRIHQSSGKPASTETGARAFTQGNNIYFAPGQYSPDTNHGRALLGHELTHVVQQRATGDSSSPAKVAERKLSGHLVAGGSKAAIK